MSGRPFDATGVDDLPAIVRTFSRPGAASAALAALVRAIALGPPAPLPICRAPVLATVYAIASSHGWAQAADRFAALVFGAPASFDGCHETAHARIFYHTRGPGAVDPSCAAATVRIPFTETVLADLPETLEVPTYPRRLGVFLEHAFGIFVGTFGLADPTDGGRRPITVTIEAAGATAGPLAIVLTPHYNDELLCAYTSHELFHVFQYAALDPGFLDVRADVWGYELFEGGAVFAEDATADRMNRYLVEAGAFFNRPGLLANPRQSLVTCGYKAALFWRYLAEQAAADPGAPSWETYTTVLTALAPASTTSALEHTLGKIGAFDGTRLSRMRRVDDDPGADLVSADTLFGNFALACYLKDLRPERRFNIAENLDDLGFYVAVLGLGVPVPSMARVDRSGPWQVTGERVAFEATVEPFAHHFVEIDVADRLHAVDVTVDTEAALARGVLVQVVELAGGEVRDLLRWDTGSVRRRISVPRSDGRLTRLVVIVSGGDLSGPARFVLSVAPAPGAPDVMVTRWNCRPGTECERDPREATWTSPDILVEAGAELHAGIDNVVTVAVRNRGAVPAAGVTLEVTFQRGPFGELRRRGWSPVIDSHGRPHRMPPIGVSSGSTEHVRVTWAPPAELAGGPVCLRIQVRAPGDPNVDNKVAITTLSCQDGALSSGRDSTGLSRARSA